MKAITLKEALEQGYTHAIDNGMVCNLSKPESIDFDSEDLYLAEKETTKVISFTASEIADKLAEMLDDEYGNHDGHIYDLVKGIDFSDVEDRINKVLEGEILFYESDIRLLKD